MMTTSRSHIPVVSTGQNHSKLVSIDFDIFVKAYELRITSKGQVRIQVELR